jgi:hypothetical protein
MEFREKDSAGLDETIVYLRLRACQKAAVVNIDSGRLSLKLQSGAVYSQRNIRTGTVVSVRTLPYQRKIRFKFSQNLIDRFPRLAGITNEFLVDSDWSTYRFLLELSTFFTEYGLRKEVLERSLSVGRFSFYHKGLPYVPNGYLASLSREDDVLDIYISGSCSFVVLRRFTASLIIAIAENEKQTAICVIVNREPEVIPLEMTTHPSVFPPRLSELLRSYVLVNKFKRPVNVTELVGGGSSQAEMDVDLKGISPNSVYLALKPDGLVSEKPLHARIVLQHFWETCFTLDAGLPEKGTPSSPGASDASVDLSSRPVVRLEK